MVDRDARQMAATIADLQRRIRALERAPRLTQSSVEGGALEVYDDTGTLTVLVGNLPDGTPGLVEVNGPTPPKPTPPLVSSRNGQALVWYRTSSKVNHVPDPGFETGVSGWTGSAGTTVAQVGAYPAAGTYSLGVTWAAGGRITRDLAGLGLREGELYTVAVTVTSTSGPEVELEVVGAVDTPPVVSSVVNRRVAVTFRCGPVAPVVHVRPVAAATGARVWLDQFSVVPGTGGDYFDGDTPGHEWTGPVHASPSVAVEPVPSDVSHVQVHVDTVPGFVPSPSTYQGAIFPSGGALPVLLPVGVLHYVKVVVATRSGKYSPPSDPTPVRVRPVGAPDLALGAVGRDQIARGAIEESHLGFTFEAGGATITYGPVPHSAPDVDDLWWDSTNGWRPNRWDGAAWVPYEFGEKALAADSVTGRQIMAGSVTTGALAAGAVSTEKLTVGAVTAGASRVLNHAFEDVTPDGTPADWRLVVVSGTAATVHYGDGPPIKGSRSLWVTTEDAAAVARVESTRPIAVRGSETWSVRLAVQGTRPVDVSSAVQVLAMTGATEADLYDVSTPGTAWTTVVDTPIAGTDPFTLAARFDVPADARFLAIAVQVGPAGDAGGLLSVGLDDVVVQPAVTGVQIANGAIRAQEIAAESIGTEHLMAGSITGAEIAGQVVLTSVLRFPETDGNGNPIPYSTLSADGYEGFTEDRRIRVRLSNRPEVAQFFDGDAVLGSVKARDMTVSGNVTIDRGGATTLGVGVTAPATPPVAFLSYPMIYLDQTTLVGEGATMPPNIGRPTPTQALPRAAFNPSTAVYMGTRTDTQQFIVLCVYSQGTRVFTFDLSGSIASAVDWPGWRLTGYVNDGKSEVAVGYQTSSNAWWVVDRTQGVSVQLTTPGDLDPTLTRAETDTFQSGATPGTFGLVRRFSGTWQVRRYRVSSGALVVQSAPQTFDAGANRPLAGVHVGIGDFTDTVQRIVTATEGNANDVRVFDASTGVPTGDGWPSAVKIRRGMTFRQGKFYDLGDDGRIYEYTNNAWSTGAGGPYLWLAATYADITTSNNPPNTTHETELSPARVVTLVKRANLAVSLPALPQYDVVGPDDANRVRLYAYRATFNGLPAPDRTAYRMQTETKGGGAVFLRDIITTGRTPPAVNDFPEQTPALLRSEAKWADGTPRFQFSGNGTQTLLPTGSIILWSDAAPGPKGYVLLDGRAVSRSGDTAGLFGLWGVAHGVGDGSTTFTLPNYTGRFGTGVQAWARL